MSDQSEIIMDTVLQGLNVELSNINIAACLPVSSLQKLNSSPAVKTLVRLFTNAKLNPRVGFNQGSGDISITIDLPGGDRASDLVESPEQAFLWFMLGLYSKQGEVETLYAERGERSTTLANQCLDYWTEHTRIAFTSKNKNFSLGYMQIKMDTMNKKIRSKEGTVYTDSMRLPYRYSPYYWRLNGYDVDNRCFSKSFLKHQHVQFSEVMTSQFWDLIHQKHYYPDPVLKEKVTTFLTQYIQDGLCEEQELFVPHHKSLSLYLHGTTGCGKSSFVKLFCSIFGKIVSNYVQPRKRSALVKVPLNCITPVELRKILLVRGISDWSVERIVEQTIACSGIALLHLEENPEDSGLQDTLFSQIQQMLRAVTTRYPEYSSNLLYVITSNYPPSENIEKQVVCVDMDAPSAELQKQWCQDVINDMLKKTIRNLLVEEQKKKSNFSYSLSSLLATLEVFPTDCKDMRILDKWKMCLNYHISHHFHLNLVKYFENSTPSPDAIHSLHVSVTVQGSSSHLNVVFGVRSDDGHTSPSIPSLSLMSHDNGYFFFDPSYDSVSDPNFSSVIPLLNEHAAHLFTIVDMLKYNYLAPAVVVITKKQASTNEDEEDPKQASMEAAALQLLQLSFGSSLSMTSLTAKSDEDREKIFGNPSSPMLGGLVAFLDSITNTLYERTDYALVLVHANSYGQFMLRELLESSPTETHRTLLRKERVLFLLRVCGELSTQMESREAKQLEREIGTCLTEHKMNQVNSLRTRLRGVLEQLILADYTVASENDVEVNLWKSCFYKVIEEFRSRARKAARNNTSSGQAELSRICTSFSKFLSSSTTFYHCLIQKLKSQYSLELEKAFAQTENRHYDQYASCHRCLVYLGDLARYHKDLYHDPLQKNWVQAAPYYQQAIKLWPENGHPWNQLAVLCSYKDDHAKALYYYYRALLSTMPFPTTQDNILALFETNKTKLSGETKSDHQKRRRPEDPNKALLKQFSDIYVRIHGILFTRSGLSSLPSLLSSALSSFHALISIGGMPETTVLQILIVNILTVHCVTSISSQLFFYSADPGQAATQVSYAGASLANEATAWALEVAVAFFVSVMELSVGLEEEILKTYHSFSKPISVFLSWIILHPAYLQKPNTTPTAPILWERMRDLLARVVTKVLSQCPANDDFLPSSAPSSEETDLRGLEPLEPTLSDVDFSLDQVTGYMAELKRMAKIVKGGFVCVEYSWTPSSRMLYFDTDTLIFSSTATRETTALPPPTQPLREEDESDGSIGALRKEASLEEEDEEEEEEAEEDEEEDEEVADEEDEVKRSIESLLFGEEDDLGESILYHPTTWNQAPAPTFQQKPPTGPDFGSLLMPSVFRNDSEESLNSDLNLGPPPGLESLPQLWQQRSVFQGNSGLPSYHFG